MILSNVELFKALDAKRIVIEPEPSPRFLTITESHSPFDTHSVDLRLGDEIVVPQPGQITYDLTKPGRIAETIQRHSEKFTISRNQPFRFGAKRIRTGQDLGAD